MRVHIFCFVTETTGDINQDAIKHTLSLLDYNLYNIVGTRISVENFDVLYYFTI